MCADDNMVMMKNSVPEDYFTYKNFEQRLLSFKNWKGKLSPLQLAKAGFYYTQVSDICQCPYCKIQAYNWEVNDSPLEEHLIYCKNCPYAQCVSESLKLKNIQDKNVKTTVKFQKHIILCLFTVMALNLCYLLT